MTSGKKYEKATEKRSDRNCCGKSYVSWHGDPAFGRELEEPCRRQGTDWKNPAESKELEEPCRGQGTDWKNLAESKVERLMTMIGEIYKEGRAESG